MSNQSSGTVVACKSATTKPSKPYPDFPLFPHATRRWAKKIKGKLHYFGPWEDPQEALNKYLDQKDDLFSGRVPRAKSADGISVRDVVNRFLTAKRDLVETGEIIERTWQDYYVVCERVIRVFGTGRMVSDLASDDFETLRRDFAKTRGPVALGNDVTRVRVLFKFAFDNGLVSAPVRYGSTFKKPSKAVLRKARADKGKRLFEPEQIRAMLDKASVPLRAMILLGINCGFGNQDCAILPFKALDLERRWASFPRPKTGIERRVPLWEVTVEALKAAIAARPKHKTPAHADLVFITSRQSSWAKTVADNPVTKETVKLLKELNIHRPGLSFYALRHTFETVGGDSRDQVAVDAIMGHAPDTEDMSAVYRERVSDERLVAVTDYVRAWLFVNSHTQH